MRPHWGLSGLILRDARKSAAPRDEGIEPASYDASPKLIGLSVAHLRLMAPVQQPPFATAADPSHCLHKCDAQHISADQHGETANGNGKIDLIHGEPSKMTLLDKL
jgi:hypothetical protein